MITTFLFGNGLGRSINNSDFELKAGIQDVWDSLNPDDRDFLLLGQENKQIKGEKDLEHYHKLASACETLLNLSGHFKNEFLVERFKEFPYKYKKFIFEVSWFFYKKGRELNPNLFPNKKIETFSSRLSNYIRDSSNKKKTHVATLNYDSILYEILYKTGILKAFEGELIDGFLPGEDDLIEFQEICFDKGDTKNMGYFLHLHGSPLYYTAAFNSKAKRIIKSIYYKEHNYEENREHIVLAKTEEKPSMITNSRILSVYFDKYIQAIDESNRVVLYGYGGEDKHVNEIIKTWAMKSKNIGSLHIVGHKDTVDCDWKKEYPRLPDKNIHLYDDILTDCKFEF